MPIEINYISIRNFVNKARDWAKHLFARKLSIGIASISGCVFGLFVAINSKPFYTGNLTFVLSTDNGSNGGLLSLANQFGLSFGNSNNAFAGENIIQLFQSKKVFQRALFTTIPDNHELLINRIGDDEYFFKKWKKDNRLTKLIPFTAKDAEAVGVKDSLIEEIYHYALTHYYTLDKVEKNLNFYKITVTSNDKDISTLLPNALVSVTAEFYSEIKSSVAKRNLQMLNQEADSLRNILNRSIQSSLVANDQIFNLNPALQSAQVSAKKNEMQTRVLQQTYQTVVQNLEIARVTLQKVTPVYQIIDEPGQTLRAYKISTVTSILVTGLFTTFFFVFFLLVKKTLQDSN